MRRMFRYVVPVDDKPHAFLLTGDPVAVAAPGIDEVEFWAEYDALAGCPPGYGDALRILNRLARLGEVEKITLPEMRCRYWRLTIGGPA